MTAENEVSIFLSGVEAKNPGYSRPHAVVAGGEGGVHFFQRWLFLRCSAHSEGFACDALLFLTGVAAKT